MLSKFFELIRGAKLKLKSSKCLLGANRVLFLGHEIDKFGMRQDPRKLISLKKLPPPEDVQGVRRVVGMMSYYRKFVPNFASIAGPLIDLTKNAKFIWGQVEQEAFETLKLSLEQNAVLANFDEIDPVKLKTDASRAGVAGILLQLHDDEWRIIACCSRRLSPAEKNYGVTDLEGLAACRHSDRIFLVANLSSSPTTVRLGFYNRKCLLAAACIDGRSFYRSLSSR